MEISEPKSRVLIVTPQKIEYIGRNDFQVKIRGFRIELGEIESKLTSYPGISQAVVLARDIAGDNSSKYLVGYYVSETKQIESEILVYLGQSLPEYMIPSSLVHLTKLPLTVNGKLDKKALPEPVFTDQDTYIAPRNDMESRFCIFYADVLGLNSATIGIKDDFFKLGGNSILVIKLVNIINNFYRSYLKVADVFSAKTIERLVKLTMSTTTSYKNIIQLNYATSKPVMFMVHPASAGCEVYSSIAEKLYNHYSCYGIDNYNLYNEEKFLSLSDLTKYYLGIMHETVDLKNQPISLFGWSMGGFISLELASILEQQGFNQIKIYLLDTLIINDDQMNNILAAEDFKNRYEKYFIDNFGLEYAKKQMDNYEIEHKINKEQISSKLKHTKVTLFRACQKENKVQSEAMDKLFKYKIEQNYNNIDIVVDDINQIKVVNVSDAHHGNIIEYEETLLTEILNNLS